MEISNEGKGGFDSFKEIKSLDDIDFNKIELSRGETPLDIKEKCLQLCKDYLSGNWSQQTVDTIEVRRITGGLTNQLYYCGIPNECESESVPREVVIRLYGAKYFDPAQNTGSNERMSDIIIALMVSEHGVGPKVYGLFEEGQILKYYPHRQFHRDDQNNEVLIKKIFTNFAKIHLMDVPIKRNADWGSELLQKDYRRAHELFCINEDIEEYNCQTLKKNNLLSEINWITGVVEQLKSPVVFTHNDFRSSNLMFTEPKDELIICDFEYSSFGYRGYDFVAIMREWARDAWEWKSVEGFPPEDSLFKPLIAVYVEECIRIKGKSFAENPSNSVDHILKEVKTFILHYLLIGVVMFLKNSESEGPFPFNRKISMEWAELNFKNYFIIKQLLKEQNIID